MNVLRVERSTFAYCSKRDCRKDADWKVYYAHGYSGEISRYYCADHLPNPAVFVTGHRYPKDSKEHFA